MSWKNESQFFFLYERTLAIWVFSPKGPYRLISDSKLSANENYRTRQVINLDQSDSKKNVVVNYGM